MKGRIDDKELYLRNKDILISALGGHYRPDLSRLSSITDDIRIKKTVEVIKINTNGQLGRMEIRNHCLDIDRSFLYYQNSQPRKDKKIQSLLDLSLDVLLKREDYNKDADEILSPSRLTVQRLQGSSDILEDSKIDRALEISRTIRDTFTNDSRKKFPFKYATVLNFFTVTVPSENGYSDRIGRMVMREYICHQACGIDIGNQTCLDLLLPGLVSKDIEKKLKKLLELFQDHYRFLNLGVPDHRLWYRYDTSKITYFPAGMGWGKKFRKFSKAHTYGPAFEISQFGKSSEANEYGFESSLRKIKIDDIKAGGTNSNFKEL